MVVSSSLRKNKNSDLHLNLQIVKTMPGNFVIHTAAESNYDIKINLVVTNT